MKTRELELIKTIDELNDRNKNLRNKSEVEIYSYDVWNELGIQEVIL